MKIKRKRERKRGKRKRAKRGEKVGEKVSVEKMRKIGISPFASIMAPLSRLFSRRIWEGEKESKRQKRLR